MCRVLEPVRFAPQDRRFHRREFLRAVTCGTVTCGTVAGAMARLLAAEESAPAKPLPVAGVTTVYRRHSHADVILGKILEGYRQDGGPGPALRLVSLFVDQVPENDMSRELAKKHGVRLARTIDEAVTLGGDRVVVDGVLSIGEHGDYPHHPKTHQHMYPRKRFFDAIVAALKRGGRVVPVFSDKHLSHRSDEALEMYRTARELKMPLMAGSSVPVAWRVPALELPLECELDGAMFLGHGGLESYGFHALEGLQCMVERRRGGETGVRAVRAVRGDEIRRAERDGYWSHELFKSALGALSKPPASTLSKLISKSTFYLIDYRDGLKASVAMLNGVAARTFAARVKGEAAPRTTRFAVEERPPWGHFEWLLRAIVSMVHTGVPAYPVERTVVTTCVLDALMRSLSEGGKLVETKALDFAYGASSWPFAPGSPPSA